MRTLKEIRNFFFEKHEKAFEQFESNNGKIIDFGYGIFSLSWLRIASDECLILINRDYEYWIELEEFMGLENAKVLANSRIEYMITNKETILEFQMLYFS